MHIISEMDAMVSMADFRYNHPEAEEAEFVSGSPEIVFEGKNLYHPFLGAKAVKTISPSRTTTIISSPEPTWRERVPSSVRWA